MYETTLQTPSSVQKEGQDRTRWSQNPKPERENAFPSDKMRACTLKMFNSERGEIYTMPWQL